MHLYLYSGNKFLPLKEDNLSIVDKMIRPNVSVTYLEVPLHQGINCDYVVATPCPSCEPDVACNGDH